MDLRKILERQNPSLGLRAHTVLIVRVEEPLTGRSIGKLYFVELAGSGTHSGSHDFVERFGKGPNDSEKYRETMSISTELKSLERAFLALPNEGILPKETPLISSIKGLLQQHSKVALIGHILATDFEESLSTLQYVERCKAEMARGERMGGMESMGAAGADVLLRNLRQVNEEYKREIENAERKYDAQFDRLKSVLGLELNIKTMMQRGPSQRDHAILENHRQAEVRVANFRERNRKIEVELGKARVTIDKLKKKIDDKQYYFGKLLKTMNEELTKLNRECEQLKVQYNNLPLEMRDQIEDERKKCMEQKERELERRLDVLFSSHGTIEQHNDDMMQATQEYENARRSFESAYFTRMREHQKVEEEEIVNLNRQYEYYIKKKKDELEKFMTQAEEYCKSKRGQMRTMGEEAGRMAQVVRQQAFVISQAEEGLYSKGIKTLNIRKSQKVNMTCDSHCKL